MANKTNTNAGAEKKGTEGNKKTTPGNTGTGKTTASKNVSANSKDEIFDSEENAKKALKLLQETELKDSARLSQNIAASAPNAQQVVKQVATVAGQSAYFDKVMNKQFVDSTEQVNLIIKYNPKRFSLVS